MMSSSRLHFPSLSRGSLPQGAGAEAKSSWETGTLMKRSMFESEVRVGTRNDNGLFSDITIPGQPIRGLNRRGGGSDGIQHCRS